MDTDKNNEAHEIKGRFLLFFVCCLAYLVIGIHFSIRGSIADSLREIFDGIDPLTSAKMAGSALAVPFLGYAITLFLISPFIDAIGMGLLMRLSGVLIVAGSAMVIGAESIASSSQLYWVIWGGMLLVGLGWGLVDTNTNPLVVALYPDDKTHKLNVIHAWWPAGVAVGGLIGIGLGKLDVAWETKVITAMVPAAGLTVLCFFAKFPLTERAASGVSFGEMLVEVFRKPMFWVWFVCMWFTATSELAPGQWVDMALSRTVGMSGMWILIYISALMFVMRHFAGPLAHKFSVVGLLWISCLLAAIGLWWLSIAANPVIAIIAATFWGAGVCFMWPTMLAAVNERYPKSGAFGMGLMGTGATLAIYFFMPIMGGVFDATKISEAGGEEAFKALSGENMEAVLATASQASFRSVAILPAVLLLVFAVIWVYEIKKRKAGNEPEGAAEGVADGQ
jgi:MFS family permease